MIRLALAVSAPSAGKTAQAAWELGARLPGVELLLQGRDAGPAAGPAGRRGLRGLVRRELRQGGGVADLPVADGAPPRKTYTQVERARDRDRGRGSTRSWPSGGGRAAEKRLSRVTMFRERPASAALSGLDLPADEMLAALAHVNARARMYKESRAFPEEGRTGPRATAYLDILNERRR